jgi:hypothetical protein
MPVNAGNFYLVAFNPNESDVTVSGEPKATSA